MQTLPFCDLCGTPGTNEMSIIDAFVLGEDRVAFAASLAKLGPNETPVISPFRIMGRGGTGIWVKPDILFHDLRTTGPMKLWSSCNWPISIAKRELKMSCGNVRRDGIPL